MKSPIVRHADSPAIVLPQSVVDACGFTNEVELEAVNGTLVIRSSASPRAGWDDRFRQMASAGDDRLILNDASPNQWDSEEWEW